MKTKDIIKEGPLDDLKARYRAFTTGLETRGNINDAHKKLYNLWISQSKFLPASSDINDTLEKFADKELKITSSTVPAPAITDPKDVAAQSEYLMNRVREYFSFRPSADSVGIYGDPKSDTTVDVAGVTYTYDFAARRWTNERGQIIQDPTDRAKLNQAHQNSLKQAPAKVNIDPSATADEIIAALNPRTLMQIYNKLRSMRGPQAGPRP